MGKNKLDQSSSDQQAKTAPPAKKAGAFQVSNIPLAGEPLETEAHKYDIGPEAAPVAATGTEPPAYEDLGELPATYHQDAIFLTARLALLGPATRNSARHLASACAPGY